MKTYKKLHESKEVANIHIAKIKERGGKVKQSIQNGKILLEYSFPNGYSFVGYRSKKSGKGIFGDWYYLYKPNFGEWNKTTLTFKKPLIIKQSDIEDYEDYVMEILLDDWLENYDFSKDAKRLNVEEGVIHMKKIKEYAISKGYDGIIFGKLEMVSYNGIVS